LAASGESVHEGLHGAWAPIAASVADKSLRIEDLRVRYLLLHAGEYRIIDASNQVVDRGHYRLDEKRSPPTMDIVGQSGPHAGCTMLAIYELRGDELTVCYDLERPERPANLERLRGQPKLRITYTRAPIASS
jgi:uncharacterized protein (TIGR03067 family)